MSKNEKNDQYASPEKSNPSRGSQDARRHNKTSSKHGKRR